MGPTVLVAVSQPEVDKPLQWDRQCVEEDQLRTSTQTMKGFDGGLGLLGRVIEVALVSSKEIHSNAVSPAILRSRCRCTYWRERKGT